MAILKQFSLTAIIFLMAVSLLTGCTSKDNNDSSHHETNNQGEISKLNDMKFSGNPSDNINLKDFAGNIMNEQALKGKIQGIIVPHHLLVGSFIDKFYKKLSENYNENFGESFSDNDSYETIVLISPNHFGYGYHYIQTTDKLEIDPLHTGESDVKNSEIILDRKSIQELNDEFLAQIEPQHFMKEHGITVQLPYLKKHFPTAKIIPIIIKNETPQAELDRLVEKLESAWRKDKTLIIASIDFTHYTAEEFAVKNDQRTIDWLQSFPIESLHSNTSAAFEKTLEMAKSLNDKFTDAVAIDSPESIYVISTLMKKLDVSDFKLWARTSTMSLTGIADPEQNTSHIFATYQ